MTYVPITTHLILPNGNGHVLTGTSILMDRINDYEMSELPEDNDKLKIIVRGLPGSGKSTIANQLARAFHLTHVEADMYHYVNGEYVFNPNNLGRAHQWCYNTYRIFDEVVVSNTFVDMKSFSVDWDCPGHYVLDENPKPFIITCYNEFGSIHNVPEKTIEKMKRNFVDPEDIQKAYYAN